MTTILIARLDAGSIEAEPNEAANPEVMTETLIAATGPMPYRDRVYEEDR